MRTAIFGMMFGLAALPAAAGVPMGSAAGASPVSTQPLAANEVLLEISALGTATSRAEMATLTGTLTSRGATETEARRVHDANVRRLTAIARRAGVAAADLTIGEAEAMSEAPVSDMNMDMEAAGAALDAASDAAAAAAETDGGSEVPVAAADPMANAVSCSASCPEYADLGMVMTSTVEIRLRNPDKVDELTQALQQAQVDFYTSAPVYSPGDQTAARRTARAQALAAARADAEAYAASLGLRVVRIVRVTERMGMDLMSLAMSESSPMRNMFQQLEQSQGPDIPTFIAVGVDFALGPQ